MTFIDGGYTLRCLHTRLLNSYDLYKGLSEQTDRADTSFFLDQYCAIRTLHIAELDRLMLSRALEPQADGSWLPCTKDTATTIRPTMPFRMMKTDVNRLESGIIDLYGKAIETIPSDRAAIALLMRHKDDLQAQMDRTDPPR